MQIICMGMTCIAGTMPISGIKGDGIADDTAALQAACDKLYPNGGTLLIPPGIYKITSSINCFGSISLHANGVTLLGSGTSNNSDRQLSISTCLDPSITPACLGAATVLKRTASGPLAVGSISLTLSTVNGLGLGDRVYLWLGTDPTDNTLPYYAMFNRISSINGSTVTFTEPIHEAIPDGTHFVWKPATIAEGITITGLHLVRDSASGNRGYNGLSVAHAQNVTISNISSSDMAFHTIVPVYGSNYRLTNIHCDHSYFTPDHSALGGCIGGWTMRNISIQGLMSTDVNGIGTILEGQNRGVSIENASYSSSQAAAPFPQFMWFSQGSKGVHARNISVASSVPGWGTAGVMDSIENLSVYNQASAQIGTAKGYLSYKGEGQDIRAYYHRSWKSDVISITPDMSGYTVNLPSGWYTHMTAYVSSTVGILNFGVGSNHTGSNYKDSLVSGMNIPLPLSLTLGPLSGAFNNNWDNGFKKTLTISTNGTVPANTWGQVEIDYYPL